jgi:hypothetical protein
VLATWEAAVGNPASTGWRVAGSWPESFVVVGVRPRLASFRLSIVLPLYSATSRVSSLRPNSARSSVSAALWVFAITWVHTRSEIWVGGFGVGQQRGCPLTFAAARTYAGQHRQGEYVPCGCRGKATLSAGQGHPLPWRQPGWIARAAPRSWSAQLPQLADLGAAVRVARRCSTINEFGCRCRNPATRTAWPMTGDTRMPKREA